MAARTHPVTARGLRACFGRSAFRLVLAWSCTGGVIGCRSRPADGGQEASRVAILYIGDERIFGPYWSVEAWFLMFLPLVSRDASGEITPRLAQRWEHSADSRRWTFHLRSDVRWHDGVPTTAYDVKFTLELQSRPDILFDDAWSDVDSIAVRDDTTLIIHYRRPKDALNTWMVYWPKHLLERLDPKQFWEWDFWTHPVGNGPYRYVRQVPKTMVELEANPDFYSGRPKIGHVILKFGGTAPVTELLSGNVDILSWISTADIPKLTADPRFRVYYHLAPEVPWLKALVWNHQRPAFRDSHVRRALTAAIDRRELLRVLNLPADLRLADVPFTPRQYHRGEIPEPIPFDTVGARALLTDAGWRDLDGDGVRERDGAPFRFSALVGLPEDEAAAVYVQAAFRRVGVEMRIERLEQSVLRQRVRRGAFDAAFFPVWNSIDGHLQWLGSRAGGESRPGGDEAARIGYHNPEVDRLLAAAKDTIDPDARDRIYRELAPMVRADLPITFLFPRVQACAVHRRVHGLESPFHADPLSTMETLWIAR